MKKLIPSWSRNLLIAVILLFAGQRSSASHVVGMDFNYKWDSGNTYTITLIAYGNCSSIDSPGGAYVTLPYSVPKVCIYNGLVNVGSINLHIISLDSAKEITPVCPSDSLNTQCHSASSPYPGIREYIYQGTYTFPSESAVWRLVYDGYMGAGAGAGRAASVTNILSGSVIELVDTLNNTIDNHHNSSPILTVVPTPFFCLDGTDNYNPGAVDPDADSLSFFLVPGRNGTSSATCSEGGLVSYIAPYTSLLPLATSSFAFNQATGQIAFVPNALQRGLVVYSIEEFRHDTLIGTSQREMTFTVITCTNTAPTASIDSMTGDGTIDDPTHYHICANSGPFTISLDPTESDLANNITVVATGLPTGATMTVTNNGTNHPHVVISWTSTGVAFGNYNFYLTYSDNNCPLIGQQTLAYTIGIYPIPTLSYAITSPATCFDSAVVSLTPGGLGQPWTIVTTTGDTLNTGVITTVTDNFNQGIDTLNIYTSISAQCSGQEILNIPGPTPLNPVVTFSNPTYCGNNDGSISLSGLNAGDIDTVNYTLNGIAQPYLLLTVGADSVLHMDNLCAGTYNNMVVSYGHCVSPAVGPAILINPVYHPIYMDTTNPTYRCASNGKIILHGLQPGQTVTVNFTKNGTAQPPFTNYVGTDSILILSGLDSALYNNIVVTTGGACAALNPNACTSNILGPVTLTNPGMTPSFIDVIHYGCAGDTVVFTNLSTAPGSPAIYYQWHFGDGSLVDTFTNPSHVYVNTANTVYMDTLIMNNTGCIDTVTGSVAINNFISASFTSAPATFVCQDSAVIFTNTSLGTAVPPPSYQWYFGDGTSSTLTSPTHAYPNSGNYQVMLVASNFVPCHDTAVETLSVDSNTVLSMHITDTTLCTGQAITLTGYYSMLGLTNVIWTFGDGTSLENSNPVVHAYDSSGTFTLTVQVFYRACPTNIISSQVLVVPTPMINLGPDTSICPGGSALVLADYINHPGASGVPYWIWNTGETTSSIVVTAPGLYYATVTEGGCIASDSVYVANDCYMDIPNVFTPNGDGTNDFFYPRQYLTRGLTSFKLDIYNRWGQNIFETTSVDGRGWDGNFNNTPQPEGVYIYNIDATFKDGQKEHRQGNITLLR